MRAVILGLFLLATVLPVCKAGAGPHDTISKAAQAHFDRGTALCEQGLHEQAIAELKAGHTLEPHPAFLYAMGQCERKRGDCEKASEYYKAVIAARPFTK